MYCRECGQQISPNASYCPSCGDQEEETSHRKRNAGIILTLVLIGAGFVLAFPEYLPMQVPENPASAYAQDIRGYVQDEVVPRANSAISQFK